MFSIPPTPHRHPGIYYRGPDDDTATAELVVGTALDSGNKCRNDIGEGG